MSNYMRPLNKSGLGEAATITAKLSKPIVVKLSPQTRKKEHMVSPAAIHVDEFKKEMISHKKACTIVQHYARNAPQLETRNPRAAVRKYSLKQMRLKN